MKKHIYFIFINCFLLLISCQDKQQINEIEENLEFSCIAKRITTYYSSSSIQNYRRIKYNQQKLVLTDSSFIYNGNLTGHVSNIYDNSNRIVKREHYGYSPNDGSLLGRSVEETTYTGSSHSTKTFQTNNNGEFNFSSERFYDQNKLIRETFYMPNGSRISEEIFIYIGELLSEFKEIKYGSGDEKIERRIEYEYKDGILSKTSYYTWGGQINPYGAYTIHSRDGNVETSTTYLEDGSKKSTFVREYDSYSNVIYQKLTEEFRSYTETSITIEYNEYGFILSRVAEGGFYDYQGRMLDYIYSKREYKEVECF